MKYLLDTDTVSYAIRGQAGVGERLLQHRPSEVAISAITVAELRYGAERKGSKRLHDLIDRVIAPIEVLPFDEDAARDFGRVAATLAAQGTPIGNYDCLIAAHAISRNLVLVTNNTRHFERVEGLRIETWANPDTPT